MAIQKPMQQPTQPQTSGQQGTSDGGRSLGSALQRTGSNWLNRQSPFAFGNQDYFNPFAMMRRMHDDIDRVFADASLSNLFGNFGNGNLFATNGGQQTGLWAPAIDISQKDGKYVVQAELPGLKQNDVNVEIGNDSLIIRGKKDYEHEEDQQGVHVSERQYGEFYRAIPLPEGADPQKAQANFHNGLLEIEVPIAESYRRRQIPISTGARKDVQSERAA